MSVIVVGRASAQTDTLLNETVRHISDIEHKIPEWEVEARRYSAISACIFALGLLIAGIQIFKGAKTNTKHVVALIGLAISGLTTWLEKGFPCDAHAYRSNVIDAQNMIRNLRFE